MTSAPGGLVADPSTAATADTTVVVLLIDSHSAAWAAWRLVRGAAAVWALPAGERAGLLFAKVLGSGAGGGFTLKPSATRGGLLCAFDSAAAADHFVHASGLMASYRRQARELACLVLRPISSRGSWGGQTLDASGTAPAAGPVAALTRASIRPLRALDFWRRAPAAQRAVEQAPGCRLAVGLGEAPLLRQATLSLWDSAAAMDAYARQGAHQQAIIAARQGRHFSESMFVRFVPISAVGQWRGQDLG